MLPSLCHSSGLLTGDYCGTGLKTKGWYSGFGLDLESSANVGAFSFGNASVGLKGFFGMGI